MKLLLLDMKKVVERFKESDKTELSHYYEDKFEERYNAVLSMAKSEIIPSAAKKKSKAHNLPLRLEKYKAESKPGTLERN